MNEKVIAVPSHNKYLLALGAVAILAVVAFGLSSLFVHAATGPSITTSVTNASNAIVTSAPIGSSITIGAVVASTSPTLPTGTVNFSTYNNLVCSGTPTTQSGVALVNGMASSSASTEPVGGFSYLVNYNGDASNTPSVSTCAAVTPTSGAVTIAPTLSNNSVNVGSSITASAVLANNTAAATGTVAYNFYTNNTCTLATTSPAMVTVTNGVVPTSAAVTFNQAGTYYLQTVYSGDNANSAATSTCGTPNVVVSAVNPTKNTPTLSLGLSTTSASAGTSVTGSSTLVGETAAAAGSVAYKAYTNSACTLGAVSAGTPTVTNGIVPNSSALLFNTAGTFYWQAMYSGDTNNNPATSSCNALTIVATTTSGGGNTGATGTISGTVYNDLNRNLALDSGEAGIAGITIQLSVLQSNWWMNLIGLKKYVPVTTTVTDANGNYIFSNLASNVYKVEEIKKAGWVQDSSDFKPVFLSTNGGDTGLNFANHANGSNGNGGGNGNGHGDGDNDFDDHVGTTTSRGHGNDWMGTTTVATTTDKGHGRFDDIVLPKVVPAIQNVIHNVQNDVSNHGNNNSNGNGNGKGNGNKGNRGDN